MSPNRIAAQDRVAPASDHILTGPVTLMNSFTVSPDRDEAFRELWTKTARYFTARPGFISLRLHRAVSARLKAAKFAPGARRPGRWLRHDRSVAATGRHAVYCAQLSRPEVHVAHRPEPVPPVTSYRGTG